MILTSFSWYLGISSEKVFKILYNISENVIRHLAVFVGLFQGFILVCLKRQAIHAKIIIPLGLIYLLYYLYRVWKKLPAVNFSSSTDGSRLLQYAIPVCKCIFIRFYCARRFTQGATGHDRIYLGQSLCSERFPFHPIPVSAVGGGANPSIFIGVSFRSFQLAPPRGNQLRKSMMVRAKCIHCTDDRAMRDERGATDQMVNYQIVILLLCKASRLVCRWLLAFGLEPRHRQTTAKCSIQWGLFLRLWQDMTPASISLTRTDCATGHPSNPHTKETCSTHWQAGRQPMATFGVCNLIKGEIFHTFINLNTRFYRAAAVDAGAELKLKLIFYDIWTPYGSSVCCVQSVSRTKISRCCWSSWFDGAEIATGKVVSGHVVTQLLAIALEHARARWMTKMMTIRDVVAEGVDHGFFQPGRRTVNLPWWRW